MRKGFTLIELLVVAAIIGLLTTLAVVAFHNVRLRMCAESNYEACDKLEMTPEEAQASLDGEDNDDMAFGTNDERETRETKRETICDLEVFNIKRCLKECTLGSHIDFCLDFCD